MNISSYQKIWKKRLRDEMTSPFQWEGKLARSAVSTATASIALSKYDPIQYRRQIEMAQQWLIAHQNEDGGFGDSPESPSNTTASLLAYAALHHGVGAKDTVVKVQQYLTQYLGAIDPENLRRSILKKYGKDLTFSVPILALCTAVGLFGHHDKNWDLIPRLPFELSILPEKIWPLLHLHVVSYAIPALICIGITQSKKSKKIALHKCFQRYTIPKALKILQSKQPQSGGFLEAAPLTSFCLICLVESGFKNHDVAQRCAQFLEETMDPNGAWPIDVNLSQWVTSLSLSTLAHTLNDNEKAIATQHLLQQQIQIQHPFTNAPAGGWGWTHHDGAAPDADDTPAALIALHQLNPNHCHAQIVAGCEWLLKIQNRDGGIPTFCRGWGKLPFDQSCPDLSAHTYHAFACWLPQLPHKIAQRVIKAQSQILRYLERQQHVNGAFYPLWFGDQYAEDSRAPIYGTATVLIHLKGVNTPWIEKAQKFLCETQHVSGAWGNIVPNTPHANFCFTLRAVTALTGVPFAQEHLARAMKYLDPYLSEEKPIPIEPFGLYFAQLWYDEKLYPYIFINETLNALEHYE